MLYKELYMHKNGNDFYVATGLETFDKKVGGLKKGSLSLLGSRPSIGKTAFAVNIIGKSCLNEKFHILFISLEMSKERIYQRLYAVQNNVPYTHCVGKKPVEENNAFLVIHDEPHQSVKEIRMNTIQFLEELRSKNMQLDLLIVDYLQLIQPHDITVNRTAIFKQILLGLKELAEEFNIAVLVLSQISRSRVYQEDIEGTPCVSDFKDIDKEIFESVDFVGILHRSNPDNENMELIIKKSPAGFVGNTPLLFNNSTLIFSAKSM